MTPLGSPGQPETGQFGILRRAATVAIDQRKQILGIAIALIGQYPKARYRLIEVAGAVSGGRLGKGDHRGDRA